MSNRLHSPTRQRQFFLGSNNDQLEREQARAARAAAIRRRKATSTSSSPLPEDPCLSEEQIVELLQNCIKLASENKINQNNTWELKLIDHLSEIIKVETVGDAETNFQKASCTLEAGVKIYSVRVDAVHAQAYKVLGGITRAGQEDDQETITAGENVDNRTDAIHPKRDFERKENGPSGADELGINDRFEDVTMFLFQGLGFTSKRNAWAGPDHWKYQKSKENTSPSESGSAFNPKKQKKKFQAEVDIDFTKSLDEKMLDIFAPPRNPKSLLLPSNRPSCSNVLPEDCHYQPENLVKLFLLPNVLCMGKWRRKLSDNYAMQQNCDYAGTLPSWDNESVVNGQYDDGYDPNDLGDLDGLVSQPRQVCKDKVSFRHVLATFPADCAAAVSKDISPHLCFICLLHLANEHGLMIRDCPSLDDLSIYLHSTQQNTDRQVQDPP